MMALLKGETAFKRLVAATVVCLVCSCANDRAIAVEEHFDESSYTAVIRANKAALFVARNQAISAHGGDMISIGPVYTVLSTTHKQALWLGFWTTLDRHNDGSSKLDVPTDTTMSLDGVILRLKEDKEFVHEKHQNWQSYPAPAPGTINRYFPVTDGQLRQIADADVITVRVSGESKTVTVYHAKTSLSPIILEFIDHVK